MKPGELLRPLGVFVLVVAVIVGGTAVAALATGSNPTPAPDSQQVQGQSPGQFQPDEVNPGVDPETGNLSVTAEAGNKDVLIDTQHANRFQRHELEPVVEALTAAGHDVDFTPSTREDSFGGSGDYNATLQAYDAVLVTFPTNDYTAAERTALREYTANDGRVVVLAEPTQLSVGSGLASSAERVTFGANDLTWEYGVRIGADALYNMDDDANDNNFRSVDAEPVADDELTAGVDEISFDYAGYALVNDSTDARVLYEAADGTRTLETRRGGTFPTVVRNENVVFVADSDFITTKELYDADNEVFVSNLLNFLVSGDKPDDVPETAGGSDDDF